MSTPRRLRIVCSSDEEDDDIQDYNIQPETLNLQGVALNSVNSNPNPTNPHDPFQIEISDEEFIDATEDLSNSPPITPPPPDETVYSSEYSTTSSAGTNQTSDSPFSRVLEDLGLRLRGEWLDSCLRGLQTSVPGFCSLDATKKAKLCFDKFLNSDMNYCGAGLLPNNVHQMHLVDLPGPFVLQIDEIVNISQPLRERYKKANPGLKRCLKLSMTDGVQRVFGMEYQPIKDLETLAPAGLKVAISNVTVRHGLIMLVPEVFQVLGGSVEELEAARQRLVTEVNKPPRGNRTRTGVVPPLATRATCAAWPPNSVLPSLSNSVSQSTTPMQVDSQGLTTNRVSSSSAVPVNGRLSSNSAVPVNSRVPSNSAVPVIGSVSSSSAVPVNGRVSSSSAVPVNGRPSSSSAVPVTCSVPSNSAVPVNARVPSSSTVPVHREHVGHQPPRTEVESSISTCRMNTEPFLSTVITASSFTVPIIRETVETTPFRVSEETIVPVQLASPVAFSGDEDVHLADRSSENPFTYLVNLSVKWAASKDNASHVEGKIKCFVTGVKEFQYKKRNTYELKVYVDDGSLISEILMDHNIVQKKIGYSPVEINTALSSSDPSRVHDMKNIMKQFQVYLVNFEGIMVVKINEASSLPVALDMQQGCSLSDAWMLLGRLKSSGGDHQRSKLDPIILSP